MGSCFYVFHIDNSRCGPRHYLKDRIVHLLGDHFTYLDVETIAPASLDEAEKMAERLNLKFNHTQEDRKPGMTGFMKGEIGIWLSTVLALRKFLESDFDSLLLFEDDVIFEEGTVDLIKHYLPKIPHFFDFFFLYTPENQFSIYGRKRHFMAYLRKNFFFDDPVKLTGAYQHWSTAAYVISKNGAARLLISIQNEITLPIDWHILRGDFKSFSFKPNGPKPIKLAELPSTIQNDRKQE